MTFPSNKDFRVPFPLHAPDLLWTLLVIRDGQFQVVVVHLKRMGRQFLCEPRMGHDALDRDALGGVWLEHALKNVSALQ